MTSSVFPTVTTESPQTRTSSESITPLPSRKPAPSAALRKVNRSHDRAVPRVRPPARLAEDHEGPPAPGPGSGTTTPGEDLPTSGGQHGPIPLPRGVPARGKDTPQFRTSNWSEAGSRQAPTEGPVYPGYESLRALLHPIGRWGRAAAAVSACPGPRQRVTVHLLTLLVPSSPKLRRASATHRGTGPTVLPGRVPR